MPPDSPVYQINKNPVTAPPPPSPSPTAALTGRYLSLSPLLDGEDCFEQLYALTHDTPAGATVWDFLPYGPFASVAAMRAAYQEKAVGGDPLFYTVEHLPNKTPAGIVSYLRIFPAAYTIEIGHIWHAVERQRGRANTEAAFLLIDNAFALGYRRVEWKCDAMNERSRQAALRLGFAFEGVFRQHCVFKDKNRDTAWFAILDKDWQAIRRNFTEWLEEESPTSLAEKNKPHVAWSLAAHDTWAIPKS